MTRDLSLFGIGTFLLRQRWVLLGVPLFLFAATVAHNLQRDRTWTASASFVPQSASADPSSFSGLAAQFGLVLGSSQPAHSPAFYSELIRSRAVLDSLARMEFVSTSGGEAKTLAQIYQVGAGSAVERTEEVRDLLRRNISAVPSRETGIVHVSARMKTPELARAVATRIVELLNEFNRETRQSQAGAEREFSEERLAEARGELDSAESRLEYFLQRNRAFSGSPQLQFEHDRLLRQVVTRQQLVDAVLQRYEQARIDQVRDIPLITILEAPVLPSRPDGRGTVARGIFALLLGTMLGLMLAFGRDIADRASRDETDEYTQFIRVRNEALAALRLPLFRRRRQLHDPSKAN